LIFFHATPSNVNSHYVLHSTPFLDYYYNNDVHVGDKCLKPKSL